MTVYVKLAASKGAVINGQMSGVEIVGGTDLVTLNTAVAADTDVVASSTAPGKAAKITTALGKDVVLNVNVTNITTKSLLRQVLDALVRQMPLPE